MIYIAEAHAMDEWPVLSGRFNGDRGPVVVSHQPKQGKERCELARRFLRDFGLETSAVEVLVDDPDLNEPFESSYAPWPLRLYLIRHGRLEWIAQPQDASFDNAVVELVRLLDLADH